MPPLDRGHTNVDSKTVASFGDEWAQHDQSDLDQDELARMFDGYFGVFPWDRLPAEAVGFDMGCGSGRWAALVAPRVGRLHCIDAADAALAVARRNLANVGNVSFYHATTETAPLGEASQDFGYSLGVLHHIPNTQAALEDCVRLLKPGAPFLVYLYYRFDNRPIWFHAVWKASEVVRAIVSQLSPWWKARTTDVIAFGIYWPLARAAWLFEKIGLPVRNMPLSSYRHASLTTLRTDSRDRFGTPLEQRFTRTEIAAMMTAAGLGDIRFSEREPYWVAVGTKV